MTTPDTPILPEIGAPFGGGFFAGVFLFDGQPHALVVAPKAEGETTAQFKTRNTASGARSLRDGLANSNAMASGNHPAAAFCRDLGIGGFTDWYLPSRHEAALMAEHMMPGEGYVPEQTTAEAFKAGGPEAFAQDWYWTSTEFSDRSAWVQRFYNGPQSNNDKDWSARVRAVRKIPL